MTGKTRRQLRAGDLADPETAARTLNELFLGLYLQAERAPQFSKFVEMEVQTDGSSSVSELVVARPEWTVRGVYVAKLFDITNSNDDYLEQSLMWRLASDGVRIPTIYFRSPNTRYLLTLELRG